MKSFILLLLLALSYAEETPSESEGADEPLVRCKRPMCTIHCDHYQTDASGCEICTCLEDPCQVTRCMNGTYCQAIPCEEGVHPCSQQEARCLPMCRLLCPFGKKFSDDGHELCECKANPCVGHICPEGQRCVPSMEENCPLGTECASQPTCVGQDSTVPHHCPLRKCHVNCNFGYKADVLGCPTCECKLDPCDEHKCDDGEMCVAEHVECVNQPCPMQPKCSFKPWCLHMAEQMGGNPFLLGGAPMGGPMPGISGHRSGGHHGPMHGHRDRRQAMIDNGPARPMQCNVDGSYKPQQCNREERRCFCVDDRGVEVDGTSRIIEKEENIPNCPYNRTQSIKGQFKMQHDLENIDDHLEPLQKKVESTVGNWLHVSQELITVEQVYPCLDEKDVIVISFTAISDNYGNVDLATSVQHFNVKLDNEQLEMEYSGHHLHAKPGSASYQHSFAIEQPRLPDRPLISGHHHGSSFQEQAVVLGMALIGTICLISVILLITRFVTKKRQATPFTHKKMDQFKENLAYNNDLYSQMTSEKKEVPVDPEVQMPTVDDENSTVA